MLSMVRVVRTPRSGRVKKKVRTIIPSIVVRGIRRLLVTTKWHLLDLINLLFIRRIV